MTEGELVEKLAIEGATAYFEMWDKLFEKQRENWRKWVKERIIPLLKEAGFVKLADDQTFPGMAVSHTHSHKIQKEYAEKMYYRAWRRVVLEE